VPARPTSPPAWVERLQAIALPVFGSGRVVRARAVIDRYNAADGGLLAAGIAYNTLFALVPMALFAGGLVGFFVNDPETIGNIKAVLVDWAPPLSSVVDEMLDGIATASPSLSLIGLVGMVWGATRLFASLETGIEAMFSEVPRRGLVARTVRRVASIAVVAGVVALAFVATSLASLVAELAPNEVSAAAVVLNLALFALPILLSSLAVGIIYRFLAPVRPSGAAIARPAFAVGLGLVLVTRLLAVIAPRVLGANFVYGTLGAIFVALGWLGLAFTLILIGASWTRERMLGSETTAPIA
jgi:YihY family inner membrane protein